jgi:predicted neutral ceramidase superfamily lipid hydrolase
MSVYDPLEHGFHYIICIYVCNPSQEMYIVQVGKSISSCKTDSFSACILFHESLLYRVLMKMAVMMRILVMTSCLGILHQQMIVEKLVIQVLYSQIHMNILVAAPIYGTDCC